MSTLPLLERIRTGDARVGVIGLGYVGLPFAAAVAEAGFETVGFDVDPEIAAGVSSGSSHVKDVADERVAGLVERGLLDATTDFDRLEGLDAIFVCVPTPLSKTGDPDVSHILDATGEIASRLQPGQLVVLESTTYPGTTRELLQPTLEESGLAAGEDFFLAFSPERVDPGNPDYDVRNTPKIVAGLTDACHEAAVALYGEVIDHVVEVSSPEAGELAKILENTFRAINIALANEMAVISDRLEIDVWEVIEAADTKPYGFMKFVPGPGLGGHCIPVDPHYLAWKMKTLQYKTRFIELASEINAEMPRHVVSKAAEALNRAKKPVNGSRVLLLGVAYKPGVDDTRESPALDVLQLLEQKGAEIAYHDPHVPAFELDGSRYESRRLTAEEL
ncbi:MAG: nucleotide sugar dehydrogenase, partial [Gemmatimonadota bacterium]